MPRLWECFGSIVCILLVLFLLVVLIRRTANGEGFSAGLLIGAMVAGGLATYLGIDGTNHLMPEHWQCTVIGVIAVTALGE